MAYRDTLNICESDGCMVILRDGSQLIGNMRLWGRIYKRRAEDPSPAFSWVLIPAKGPRRTWNSAGCFSIHSHVVSQMDVLDFIIGRPPTIPKE